jgi:uncharacterized protein YbcI
MNRHVNDSAANIAQQLAGLASRFQEQRTGHPPRAVSVVLSDDTLVFTLYEALTLAERVLAASPEGAAKVQEFHRQLFADSADPMRQAIQQITGRQVRESAAEIETATGTVVHAFTSGNMVQVFLLNPVPLSSTVTDREAASRAEDDGLRVECDGESKVQSA